MDLLDDDDADAALEIAEELLEDAPDDVDFLELRGLALSQLGDYEEALETFEKIVAKDAEDIDGLARVIETVIELGRLGEAEKRIDKLVALAPAFGLALQLRGTVRDIAGKTEEADADFDKAAELDEELGPPAPRLSAAAFQRLFDERVADLDDEHQAAVARCQIIHSAFPALEAVHDPGSHVSMSSPLWLDSEGEQPRLFVYRRNIERVALDEAELGDAIEDTLLEVLATVLEGDE